MMRRMFTGAFFTTQPLYQKLLASEMGRDFVTTNAGFAAKRVMSESLEEALAAVAFSGRSSGEFGRGSLSGRAPGMPTIDSVGSVAGLAAGESGDSE